MAIPQLCNLGLSGFSYAGTDVGGFGADTTKELLARWVQVGCLSPFFRNHSAQGTRKQEPWQFDKELLEIYRKYVELRYHLLPYIYDCFFESEQTGLPIMRPLMLNFEKDAETYEINDEFMVGEWLLAAPVVTQGTTTHYILALLLKTSSNFNTPIRKIIKQCNTSLTSKLISYVHAGYLEISPL